MKKIIISDVTLRDGNHVVNHQINLNIIKKYCSFAEEAKIPIIEIGHGNGLGASSLAIGRSAVSDKKALIAARKLLKKTKLSVHSIPGFSTLEDLKSAIDCGVDIIRVGCNSTDIDIISKQVEYCFKNKVEVWGVLMMFHLIYPNKKYLKLASFLKDLGLKTLIIMDSSGSLLPKDIKNIFSSLCNKFKFNLGFHGHNNFGCAISNSLEALDNGANIIDVSMQGFGAGAGNTQMEILLTLLEKDKKKLFINLDLVYKQSEKFESLIKDNGLNYSKSFSEPMNILSAKYGLFSGFASHVNYYSNKFNLSKLDSFRKINEKKLVAGQEDLIMNILYNLKNRK
jgi:4-hydroxy 2-oxovalerate aldolase